MKYNLSKIMTTAWQLFRKYSINFAEALHRAWMAAKAAPINTARIEAAKQAAGIDEECNTWAGWKSIGREVIHGSKALFQVVLIYTPLSCQIHSQLYQSIVFLKTPILHKWIYLKALMQLAMNAFIFALNYDPYHCRHL